MTRNRSEDIADLLEMLTQEYFDNIASRIATPNKNIYPDDWKLIRGALGPITFEEFKHYLESTGDYVLISE